MAHYRNFSFDFNDPTFDFGGYTFAFRISSTCTAVGG